MLSAVPAQKKDRSLVAQFPAPKSGRFIPSQMHCSSVILFDDRPASEAGMDLRHTVHLDDQQPDESPLWLNVLVIAVAAFILIGSVVVIAVAKP